MSRRKKKEIARAKAKAKAKIKAEAKERRRRAKPKAPTETIALRPGLRKTSEMITELGGGFVVAGQDLNDMQSRLNVVCTAWNYAIMPADSRAELLHNYMEDDKRRNPTASATELAELRQYMEDLIDRKLELFPDEDRPIVGGQVVPTGEKRISINVVSGYRPQDVLWSRPAYYSQLVAVKTLWPELETAEIAEEMEQRKSSRERESSRAGYK